jgi:hypothetical protein
MNQRWQTGLSPFDGDILFSDDPISVQDLQAILAVIVQELEVNYATQNLYTFDDWHEHDGYVTERRPTEWSSLAAVAQSADALIASRQGDTYVHRSYYPKNLSFLLRYDVFDEESRDTIGFSGSFDLSADSTMIAKVFALVPLGLQSRLQVEPSKGYFDSTYAGG